MGKQYNKTEKRKRRSAYLKRRKVAAKTKTRTLAAPGIPQAASRDNRPSVLE